MQLTRLLTFLKMAAPIRDRLRQRIEPPSLTAIDLNSSTSALKSKPKTPAERSKDYYTKVKNERPYDYDEKLTIQKSRSKRNREEFKIDASEEEKAARREKNNLRMKAYRERKKLENALTKDNSSQIKKPLTRQQKENLVKRKEKERDRKRKEREGWSTQKKHAERKKARDRYHNSKLKNVDISLEPCDGDNERTVAARAQAVSRVNQALPKDTIKRQQTITDFIMKNSNTENQGMHKSITETLLNCNDGLDSKDRRHLKRLLATKVIHMPKKQKNQCISMMKTTAQNISSMADKIKAPLRRQKLKDIKRKQKVQKFFLENSRAMPTKRMKPVKVLEDTLINLYNQYLQGGHEHVSFAFFCRYRPKRIRPQSFVKFNQSLCEICENIDLKIKAINTGSGKKVIKNRQHLLDIILCPKEDYFRKDCIDGKCSSCGFSKLRDLIEESSMCTTVEVREWGLSDVKRGDATVKKKVLLTKEIKMMDVLDALEEAVKFFPRHNFFAHWQYSQYKWKRENIQAGEVIAVLDFAENYRCSSQDEAQAAHWNYLQATIHPIVLNYKCYFCSQNTCESVIAISDDLTHDAAAVFVFTHKAMEHIKKRGNFHRMIQFTDGCSAQYKSKQPFMDLQTGFKSFDFSVERNFFGSRHGKGPADGESAVVKSGATRAVKNRRFIIQNARDLFNFCNSTLARDGDCLHFKRTFLFVGHNEIQHRRQAMNASHSALKTIKGTRGIHSIRVKDDRLFCRNLTCFCAACEGGASGHQCGKYADVWQEHSMLTRHIQKRHETDTSLQELSTSTLEYLERIDDADLNGTQEKNSDYPQAMSTSTLESLEIHPHLCSGNVDLVPNTTTSIETTVERNDALKSLELEHIDPDTQNIIPTADNAKSDKNDSHELKVKPGAWVLAYFSGKSKRVFLGLVLDVDGPEAQIKFCRRVGQVFTWPPVEDIGWMQLYCLTPINVPDVDGRERMRLPDDLMKIFY